MQFPTDLLCILPETPAHTTFLSLGFLKQGLLRIDLHHLLLHCAFHNPSAMLSLRSIFTASGRLRSLRRSIISPLYRNAVNNVTRSFSQLKTSPWTINNIMTIRSKGGYETAKASTSASTTYLLSQTRGMKTRSSVKRLCDGCKVSFCLSCYYINMAMLV